VFNKKITQKEINDIVKDRTRNKIAMDFVKNYIYTCKNMASGFLKKKEELEFLKNRK